MLLDHTCALCSCDIVPRAFSHAVQICFMLPAIHVYGPHPAANLTSEQWTCCSMLSEACHSDDQFCPHGHLIAT